MFTKSMTVCSLITGHWNTITNWLNVITSKVAIPFPSKQHLLKCKQTIPCSSSNSCYVKRSICGRIAGYSLRITKKITVGICVNFPRFIISDPFTDSKVIWKRIRDCERAQTPPKAGVANGRVIRKSFHSPEFPLIFDECFGHLFV